MKNLIFGFVLLGSFSSFGAGIECQFTNWHPAIGDIPIEIKLEEQGEKILRTQTIVGSNLSPDSQLCEVIVTSGTAPKYLCQSTVDMIELTDDYTINADGTITVQMTADSTDAIESGFIPKVNPLTGEETPYIQKESVLLKDCKNL